MDPQDNVRESTRRLAEMPLETALQCIQSSPQWREISRSRSFYRSHTTSIRSAPKIYNSILHYNDETVHRFGLYCFEGQQVLTRGLNNDIRQVIVSTCDRLVGLFSKTATHIEYSVWNPYRNPGKLIGSIEIGAEQAADINLTVGFGCVGNGQQHVVYTFFPNTRMLTRYSLAYHTELREVLQEPALRLRGKACNVTIDGVAYWRGSYGFEAFKDRNAQIFYPTIENGHLRLNTIDYPLNLNLHRGFSRCKLSEFRGRLGFVTIHKHGSTVNFRVMTYQNRTWQESHRGHLDNMFNCRLWLSPDYTLLIHDLVKNLSVKIRNVDAIQIGQYEPVLLNHINTLCFY